jgi:transcription antitermination factor NusG
MTQWYALRTASRRERVVAANLAERGFPIFLPMETSWRGPHRHMEPLMPGYVFALCEPEDFANLHGIEGVQGFVRYIREDGIAWPAAFPATVILGLQIEERWGAFDATRQVKPPRYRPRKGDTVRIMAGTYYGFMAKVLAAPQGERCKLLIDGFEKARHRTEDVAHLTAA